MDLIVRPRVPGGLGSGFPVGAAGWWPQNSEPPAHGNAAPKRHCLASPDSDDAYVISQHTHTQRGNVENDIYQVLL